MIFQKRKACTLSQTHLLLAPSRDTRSLSRVRSYDSSNSKSSLRSQSQSSPRNHKRQTVARSSAPRLRKSLSGSSKDTFANLESLFDLGKPLEFSVEEFLPDYQLVEDKTKKDLAEDSASDCQFGSPEDYIEKLKPVFSELEPPALSPVRVLLPTSTGGFLGNRVCFFIDDVWF